MLKKVEHGLIASCQALEDEPLHSSFIMAKMALAAMQGGAVGIRANSKQDIQAIKKEVSLPVVGIVKRDYPDSDVFITATKKEVDELIESGCEMIAMDATLRERPNGEKVADLVSYVKTNHPHVQLMADISTLEDALEAERLGFDCVSTTLYGYTSETSGNKLYDNDFEFVKIILDNINIPVIAEGNVVTPEMAKRVLSLGVYSVVVGGAISRPQQITSRFVEAIKGE
ncbi:N-acetylmannosamine-6-phosphate 2-epimerase [Lederbergia citrea]|uniref:Putative N-acetylmannosamine-6-phosphate 2-epimerase n=1 Tax=Lederbergia citrea TaxID=2833581 RepID=A0A942USU3_9BACI|nr:N-acetylmannosamine-6-phosphate 2-epimerase [Lederbergia citrea]MBS4206110.1 N-acetylmannosamine-6-phosphate 2-epimerase [Lederbergia citrea]MBS4224441.1 N-acetylmannosamine-6-phosphate 2-epimerase [Lederbergia citrea]